MATIHREIHIDQDPETVWSALKDWGALHTRLAPGFVTDTQVEEDTGDRIVTFFTGTTAREKLVTSDDAQRRLVWSVRSPPYTHHNGVAQAHPDGSGTRFSWTADLTPDAIAEHLAPMMERGLQTIAETLRKRRT